MKQYIPTSKFYLQSGLVWDNCHYRLRATYTHHRTGKSKEDKYKYTISLCGNKDTGAINQTDPSKPDSKVKIVGKHNKASIYFGGGNEISIMVHNFVKKISFFMIFLFSRFPSWLNLKEKFKNFPFENWQQYLPTNTKKIMEISAFWSWKLFGL